MSYLTILFVDGDVAQFQGMADSCLVGKDCEFNATLKSGEEKLFSICICCSMCGVTK